MVKVEEVDDPTVDDIMGIIGSLSERMERAEIAIADTASLLMAFNCDRDVPEAHIKRALEALSIFVVDLGKELKERDEVRLHLRFLDSRE